MNREEQNRIYYEIRTCKLVTDNITKWSEEYLKKALSVEIKTRQRRSVIKRLQGRLNKLRNIRLNKKLFERMKNE